MAKVGTLAPGAPIEAPSEPSPGACPIGGRVRRDAIPTAPRSGVGVAKGQYRSGAFESVTFHRMRTSSTDAVMHSDLSF